MCLELIRLLQLFSYDLVVVDFAVDSKNYGLVLADERLSSRICSNKSVLIRTERSKLLTNSNNAKTLVDKN